jgi:hypothetical protein
MRSSTTHKLSIRPTRLRRGSSRPYRSRRVYGHFQGTVLYPGYRCFSAGTVDPVHAADTRENYISVSPVLGGFDSD